MITRRRSLVKKIRLRAALTAVVLLGGAAMVAAAVPKTLFVEAASWYNECYTIEPVKRLSSSSANYCDQTEPSCAAGWTEVTSWNACFDLANGTGWHVARVCCQ